MKKIIHKRLSRKVIFLTLIIPILMCLAIIIGICLNTYVQVTVTKSVDNNESLVLALIGVAISVWVGLNIYNVLSKEELKLLLEQAEDAANITSKVYTESLKSKFRVSFSDRTANYLITQLDSMDSFPDDLLEKILELEDLFNFAYSLYCDGLSTKFNEIGVKKAEKLLAYSEEQQAAGIINKEQDFFLRGYCSLRGGDFSYFRIQYDKELEKNIKNLEDLVENAAQKYKNALYYLFRIRDIRYCGKPENYTPEERISLAILANNIGSVYLVKPAILNKLAQSKLDEIIEVEKIAVDFSTEISDLTRSVYIRNLGAAYEKKDRQADAFEQYCIAFRLNQKSWKAARCIGSWYGKKLRREFPDFPGEESIGVEELEEYWEKLREYAKCLEPKQDEYIAEGEDKNKDIILDLLQRSTYWNEVTAANNGGLLDKWLVIRYGQLYILTGKDTYRVKMEESKQQLKYQEEVSIC